MQELRNRAIHEQASPLLESYRGKNPELVRHFESTLDSQYALPKSSPITNPGPDANPAPAP